MFDTRNSFDDISKGHSALKISNIKRIKNIFIRFKEKDVFTLAASVSFYAFLSIFPFFIIVIYFSTLVLKESVVIEKIQSYFRLFPPSVSDTFIGNLESILESGQVFSLISFLFLIYFSFKVFNSIENALDIIYGTKSMRKEWKAKLKAFSFFLITAFILVILFFSGSIFFVFASKLERIPFVRFYYVILLSDFVVETLFFSLSYKYLSNRKLSFKSVLSGGFVATVLWEILKHIFGIYIASINRYSIIFGSLGSLILLLLWLYYSILVYLFGAEISAELS